MVLAYVTNVLVKMNMFRTRRMLFYFAAVEELYGTWYQSASFSLINVGSGFYCLRSFFFLSFILFCQDRRLCELRKHFLLFVYAFFLGL